MENSQHIYDGIASSFTKLAMNLDSTIRKKSIRINTILQELTDHKFSRPIISATAFQPSKSMDPTLVTTLRANEEALIAACETQIQQLRLEALQSDNISATAELAKFTTTVDLKTKITKHLPILSNQPITVTNIANDIATRISNFQSEKARKASAVAVIAPVAMEVVEQPIEAPTLESIQEQLQSMAKTVSQLAAKLQQANDSGSRHRQRRSADTTDGKLDNRKRGSESRSRSHSAQPRRNRDERDNLDSGSAKKKPPANNKGQQKINASSKNSRK